MFSYSIFLQKKTADLRQTLCRLTAPGKALTAFLMGGKVDLCASTLSAADKQLANGQNTGGILRSESR